MAKIPCPVCLTTGKDPVFKNQICPRCQGDGYIIVEDEVQTNAPQGSQAKSGCVGIIVTLVIIILFGLFIWYMATKR